MRTEYEQDPERSCDRHRQWQAGPCTVSALALAEMDDTVGRLHRVDQPAKRCGALSGLADQRSQSRARGSDAGGGRTNGRASRGRVGLRLRCFAVLRADQRSCHDDACHQDSRRVCHCVSLLADGGGKRGSKVPADSNRARKSAIVPCGRIMAARHRWTRNAGGTSRRCTTRRLRARGGSARRFWPRRARVTIGYVAKSSRYSISRAPGTARSKVARWRWQRRASRRAPRGPRSSAGGSGRMR